MIRDIVVDCTRPSQVAAFWADALDGYRIAPYDDAERERLRGMGITDIADDPTVLVEPVDGVGPRLFFQLVPEAKERKNRVHLDLTPTTSMAAEIERLEELGARVYQLFDGHIVLTDVEGNEFCLMK